MIKVSLRWVISYFLFKKTKLRTGFLVKPKDSTPINPRGRFVFCWSQAAGAVETPQRKPFVVFQFEVNSAVFFFGVWIEPIRTCEQACRKIFKKDV